MTPVTKVRAYDKGYCDGFEATGQLEDIYMDSANTGILQGVKCGFKIGYHLGLALINTINLPTTPQLIRKNKIHKDLIECASKLDTLSLSDDSYSELFEKNLQLARQMNAINSTKKLNKMSKFKDDNLDF